MLAIKHSAGFIGVLILIVCLQACGQKGPLFLPQDDSKEEQNATN
ncbi:hypothetical protein MNBD_GAMMA16-88 [hydrothermal vent metagenome]|uniref:Lipoprotein n=1 Tax=hydrothermal vent metagenome TaxID=652676 RepID=A0A3B0Z224_9ZZZZ